MVDIFLSFFDFILHLDQYLTLLVEQFGWVTYLILFAIIFCETGLVFTPILPGDSLIFLAATLAAQGTLNVWLLWVLFLVASIVGDSVNYWIGGHFGKRLANTRFLKKEYMERTEAFYEKYGKKTIIIARFIPIVRTFAPFMAGTARMNYRDFLVYNVVGAFVWVTTFVLAGYFFGTLPWVQNNLHTLVFVLIGVSLLPPLWEFWRGRKG